MKILAYSINFLALLSILPFISCGNKQADVDKQNKTVQTDSTKTDLTKTDVTSKTDSQNVTQSGYKLEPNQVIIKPSDEQFKTIFGDKYKYRELAADEIPAAEKLLKECFNKDKSGTVDHFLDRSLDEYNRQFVGAADAAGDKIIWVNCAAKSDKDNGAWKNRLILSTGGGNNFFNVKINSSKGNYYDLKINGPASLSASRTIIEAGNDMQSEFGANYTSWTPDESDIQAAEKILAKAFEDQKKPTVNRLLDRKPDDYCQQFVGATDANGDRIIWVNCFCKDQESQFKNWKNNIVTVKDGGNCFFNITINISENSYTSLDVNGNG